MRKKILIGVMIVTSLGVAIGGHFFARTNAQDPPKKADPEKKSDGDLFGTIKQSLEGKKDPAPVLPPAPVVQQQPIVAPPPLVPVVPKDPLPTFPGSNAPVVANGPLPALPAPKDSIPQIPWNMAPGAVPPVVVGSSAPPLPPPSKEPNPQIPVNPVPGLPPVVVGDAKPPIGIPPTPPIQPPLTNPTMPAKIADDLAKVKDSPWAMHVEMVNGQTVVSATVHQKHEFKIVCQSLDVQTGKGTLKASGKVRITGDMLTANCGQLSISLLEDRLLLEGNAVVSIQKLSANVSSEKPASFELKGTTLDLRISDLQAKFRQTSLSVEREISYVSPRIVGMKGETERDGKQWTPYGTLKRGEPGTSKTELRWRLEGRDGSVIALLVARDGGTLAQFEGQSISVFGAREQLNGESVLRVTHIAVP